MTDSPLQYLSDQQRRAFYRQAIRYGLLLFAVGVGVTFGTTFIEYRWNPESGPAYRSLPLPAMQHSLTAENQTDWQVHWSLMIGNVLLWTSVAGIVGWIPAALQISRIRRRLVRGECIKCGHPQSGSAPTCQACGAPVSTGTDSLGLETEQAPKK